jgi:hypothetical protein
MGVEIKNGSVSHCTSTTADEVETDDVRIKENYLSHEVLEAHEHCNQHLRDLQPVSAKFPLG